MKPGIHPDYHTVTVRCACGNTFTTGSTQAEAQEIEVCSSCHPFYTGVHKFVDTKGKIDRFEERRSKATATKAAAKAKKAAKV